MNVLTHEIVTVCSGNYEIRSNIVEIGPECFKNCRETLTSFSFEPDPQLTLINNSAFSGCKHLESINLSPCLRLINIESYAFQGCSNIKNLILPERLQAIGSEAFSGNKLTSVSLPSSVRILSWRSFKDCSQLTNFNIPTDSLLQIIDFDVFHNTSINSLFLPKHLYSMLNQDIFIDNIILDPENSNLSYKEGILYSNKNKTICWCNNNTIINLTLGDEIETIEKLAFYNCTSLKYINIQRINSIKDSAFSLCNSLYSVEIISIDEIGSYSFSGCSIYSLNILSVNEIGSESFYYCPSLYSVNITSVNKIGAGAFFLTVSH